MRARGAVAALARSSGSSGARARACSPPRGGHASYALLEALDVEPDALRRGARRRRARRASATASAFRHGLIGEVLYERLLPAERAALHRAIAPRSTTRRSARTTAIAPGCGARRSRRRSRPGREAARVFAYAEAAVHFERALELADETVDRVDLLARAAQAARFSGDPERAVARCREAIATRARRRPPRAPVRAARRVPLLGRRGRAACYEEALGSRRAIRGCSPPRVTR